MENLHGHSSTVLDTFGFLILNLKNPTDFFGLLQKMAETHKEKFVCNNHMNVGLLLSKDDI